MMIMGYGLVSCCIILCRISVAVSSIRLFLYLPRLLCMGHLIRSSFLPPSLPAATSTYLFSSSNNPHIIPHSSMFLSPFIHVSSHAYAQLKPVITHIILISTIAYTSAFLPLFTSLATISLAWLNFLLHFDSLFND